MTATVPSAISLTNSCHDRAAWSFGAILPGSATTTATGANVCRFTWSSSNDSSMLRIHQADRTGAAMVGDATTRTNVWGAGAPIDFAGAGSTFLGMTEWDGAPLYQSIDSGASMDMIGEPGDYSTIGVASSTVAWRAGFDGVQISTNANAATPTWNSVPTPAPGCIWPGEVDALSASTAWMVCDGKGYRTVDGGTNWSATAGEIASNASSIEAIDATTAFSVGWGTITRSNDANVTWSSAMTGINVGSWMAQVSASPQTPGVVWSVDTSGSVYRSTNSGTNWAATAGQPQPFEALVIEAVNDSSAIVGGSDGIVYRTTDTGATWTRLRIPSNGALRDIVALDANHLLFAGVTGATYSTTDGGTTWLNGVAARDAASDTAAIDVDTIATTDGYGRIQLSHDGGASWDAIDTGLAPRAVRGVAIHGSGQNDGSEMIIAVGDSGSIVTSFDGGSSWTVRSSGTTQDLWDVDLRSDGVAIAVGGGGTILRSTDWGSTWSSVGAAAATLHAVALKPGGHAVAVGEGGLVRSSSDSGLSWTTRASTTTADLVDLAMPSEEVAYASGYEVLVKTTDSGATWSAITTMAAGGVWGTSRVAAPTEDSVWVFQSFTGGWTPSWVARSRDGGVTWELPLASYSPGTLSPIALDSGTVLVPGEGGNLRRIDVGEEIADYTAGAWAGATARFGVCLQALGGSATPGALGVDGDGTCTISDADPWSAVPTAPVKVGQVASAGTGSADLVFGMRADNTVTPGNYSAGIVVTALAPNA